MVKGISLFDVDGPLRAGGIALWPDFLNKQGLFSNSSVERVNQDLTDFKKGKIDYHKFAIEIINHMAQGLKGHDPEKIKAASIKFATDPKMMQLHPYAVELIDRMNKRGITIAITGQPQELAEAFMHVLPFHMSIGTEFEVINGKYTGKVKRNMAIDKGFVLKELKKHPNYWRGHKYGFGDRITDQDMLKGTTKPIALNPDQHMETYSRKKGWIVAHGKTNPKPN